MNIKPVENKLFRICTEDKQRGLIEVAVGKSFQGYTIIKADGYWNNVFEHSLIIEIVTPFAYRVHEVARAIKELNQQQAVLVQELEIGETFI